MCDLKELLAICGTPNPAGTTIPGYWVEASKIDTFPGFLTTTNPGDSITLDGDITLLATEAFKKIEIIQDTGEVKDTLVGPVGGKSFDNMYTFSIGGSNAEQLEFAKCTANACVVIIVKDKAGVFRVIGTKELPARIDTAEVSTGLGADSLRGGAYVAKVNTGCPAPVYTGVIDETV